MDKIWEHKYLLKCRVVEKYIMYNSILYENQRYIVGTAHMQKKLQGKQGNKNSGK